MKIKINNAMENVKVNNNYKIIRDFLLTNGAGVEYTDKNGDKRIERARMLEIENFKTINVNGEELELSHPIIIYSRKREELDGELFFNASNATYGRVSGLEIDDECAELFVKAIKNGDLVPLPIMNGDNED